MTQIALESTVIAHGLPKPKNLEVALELEELARSKGCTPKTVGIVEGVPKVGLTKDEIVAIATKDDVLKVGTAEISLAIARKLWAATTVSATMHLAKKAGVDVFATGGIGGVHGGEWDVSQDITELSRTRMIVVSAGAKSILDLKQTLEMLETFQVTVVGYRTDEFPAFYSRRSGLKIISIDTIEEVVEVYKTKEHLDLPGAVLVCNPIPEESEIPLDTFNEWKEAALKKAELEGISGKALTPYILSEIARISGGKTVEANVALLKNNVELACEIALILQGGGYERTTDN